MPLDIEHTRISVALTLAAWKETLRELGDVPEIRGEMLSQLLDVIGLERRGELTDQGMHHAILARPGASRGRGKRRSDAKVEDVN